MYRKLLALPLFAGFLLIGIDSFSILTIAAEPSLAIANTSQTTIGGLQFHVAPGWNLKNTTLEGLSVWPIAATWDSQNNLVVIESAGVQDSVQKQLETLPHRVVRLKDSDHDGVFDKREIVAEQLPFPEGVLCVGNDILVSAPPQIIRLIDADGDGVAENRTVWHDGKTLTGCANDLHGPFLGPEGWLYWCKAAFAEQIPELSGPFASASKASHLYRKRIDDTQVDRLMTGGMDNLVDITFNSLGERFFVATFLHHPGGGVRDGLGHAPYGAVYGKPNAVLQGHPRTGPLFEPMVEMGPAAPAGVLATSNGQLIAAQFNLQRVSMHQIENLGASFGSKNTDLVTSEQLDFHPVDILQDIDGSLIVVDTGGWYDLCCPSSGSDYRIAPGGIYRLTPEQDATGQLSDPQKSYQQVWAETHDAWKKGDWEAMLTSPAPRVREWGTEAWLSSGAKLDAAGKVIDDTQWLTPIALDLKQPTEVRAAAFWAMARWIERHDQITAAPEFVKTFVGRSGDPLQIAALNLISTYRWKEQRGKLENLLQTASSPAVQRLAAECLGRIGDKASILPLLQAWESSRFYSAVDPDRTLQHAFFFAILEIASHPENQKFAVETLAGTLQSSSCSDLVAYASLSTLQQLDAVTPELAPALLKSLKSDLKPLVQIVEEILANQPACLDAYLQALPITGAPEMVGLEPSLTRVLVLAKNQPVALKWIAANVLQPLADPKAMKTADASWRWSVEQSLLKSLSNQPIPSELDAAIGSQLQQLQLGTDSAGNSAGGDSQRLGAVQGYGHSSLGSLLDLLRQTVIKAENPQILEQLRSLAISRRLELAVKAIAATPRGSISVDEAGQQAILDAVLDDADRAKQVTAWQAISKIDLSKPAWETLASKLAGLSTSDYPKGIQALATSSVLVVKEGAESHPQAVELMNSILNMPLTKTLTADQILKWFQSQPEAFKSELNAKLITLFAPPEDMAKSIESLASSLPTGDAFRGQDIYRSSKAACSACHRIGYVGGNIGPELTRIGRSRSQRDFLEAILFPSHRIEQGFGSTNILTLDDEVLSGIVAFEDDHRVEIVVSADKKVSVAKEDIQERSTSTVSLMPAGIDKLLTAQELADLLAFLQQAK